VSAQPGSGAYVPSRFGACTVWPAEEDLGSVVLLPGGETGVLRSWATDPDRSSWTWSLELRGRAP